MAMPNGNGGAMVMMMMVVVMMMMTMIVMVMTLSLMRTALIVFARGTAQRTSQEDKKPTNELREGAVAGNLKDSLLSFWHCRSTVTVSEFVFLLRSDQRMYDQPVLLRSSVFLSWCTFPVWFVGCSQRRGLQEVRNFSSLILLLWLGAQTGWS